MFSTGPNQQVHVWQISRVKMVINNGFINIFGRNYIIFNFKSKGFHGRTKFLPRAITQGKVRVIPVLVLVRSMTSTSSFLALPGKASIFPIAFSLMLFLSKVLSSFFNEETKSRIKVSTSILGRFQFSVEKVYKVR